MQKFNYNPANKGMPKAGGSTGGDGFPPCKVVVAFRKAYPDTGKDQATLGKPMVITEWEVLQVVRRDYVEAEGYRNWKGETLRVEEGIKRSYVIWQGNDGKWSDLNAVAALLNGVDIGNPAAMRAAGLTAKDDSAAETDRVCGVYNAMLDRMMAEDGSNPFGETILELNTRTKETKAKRTFMVHQFGFPTDPEALKFNAEILAKVGLKIAA